MAAQDLFIAIDRNDPDELEIVLNYSKEGLNGRYKGSTPLWYAISKEVVNIPIVEILLREGADPNIRLGPSQWSSYLVQSLIDAGRFGLAMLLIRHGADTSCLYDYPRWLFLEHHYQKAFSQIDGGRHDVTLKHRLRAYSNPENQTDAIKAAFRKQSQPKRDFAGILRELFLPKEEIAWSLVRHTQSLTVLPNGNAVLIAGQDEAPNGTSWINFNDVIILTLTGDLTIYGYPESDFPFTADHTATQIGEYIYIVGGQDRVENCGVYRLSLDDFRIDHCATTGTDPGPLLGHDAKLIGDSEIHIWGENWANHRGKQQLKNEYELCVKTLKWSIAASLSTDQ